MRLNKIINTKKKKQQEINEEAKKKPKKTQTNKHIWLVNHKGLEIYLAGEYGLNNECLSHKTLQVMEAVRYESYGVQGLSQIKLLYKTRCEIPFLIERAWSQFRRKRLSYI